MMDENRKYFEDIQKLKLRTKKVLEINTFSGAVNSLRIDRQKNVLMPPELDNIKGKLMTDMACADLQLYYWHVTDDQNYLMANHHHTYSDEFIYVIDGEIINTTDNVVLTKNKMYHMAPNNKHEWFFKAGAKFLVGFVPALALEVEDG